ncbi:hypothetical protein VTO42DRAFT_5802 [Malbranchea cinnamomea]
MVVNAGRGSQPQAMELDSYIHSRKRLEELAARSGVFMNQSPRSSRTWTIPPFTENDRVAADRLLVQKRQEAFSAKSHVFRRIPSQRGFKRDEIYTAMESVILNDGSPGALRYLLELSRDAKAKRHLLHKDASSKVDIGTLLRLALEKGDSGMVHILAQDAPAADLDASLKVAVSLGFMDCVAVLLQSGANPNACSGEFLTAVDSGDRRFVELFLGARLALERYTLDTALTLAVRRGVIQTVISLLQSGADGNNAEALGIAVRQGRIGITAALILAPLCAQPATLDEVFHHVTGSQEVKFTLLELLLCGGARGINVAKTLVEAVRQNEERLVSLIVAYNGPVGKAAILTAIMDGNLPLLRILFRGHLGAEDASYVLETLPKDRGNFATSDLLYIVESLVARGASGHALDTCLIRATQQEELPIVEFLINKRASVDYQDAEALLFSIESGSVQIFKALLQGKPSQDSLRRCVAALDRARPSLQLFMMEKLLEAGAKGDIVDKALVRAVAGEFVAEKESLVETLVRSGADVNTESGICFQKVVRAGDIVVLNLLLSGKASPEALSMAIPCAFELHDKKLQYTMIDILLSSGARGSFVNQKVLELLEEGSADILLINLLLEKGEIDVNLSNGKLLRLACQHRNNDLLKLLLQHRPSTLSLNAAFPIAFASRAPDIQYKLCQQLLAAGVQGEVISRTLVDGQSSLSSSHPRLLELLLDHGADVNFRDGSVIRRAIRDCNVQQLGLLVSKKPSPHVLAIALDCLVSSNMANKTQMANMILEAGRGLLGESVDRALPAAVGLEPMDMSLLELLLRHGARVDHDHGLALRRAIENRNLDIVQLLLSQPVTMETLEAAFRAAWALGKKDRTKYARCILLAGYRGSLIDDALLDAVREKPYDLSDIKLLLDHGASVHHQKHSALVNAATSMNLQLLELLLGFMTERIGATFAFGELIASNMDWLSANGYPIVGLLLRNGASGDLLAIALVMVVENLEGGQRSIDFVDLLLRHGANVNYQSARALQSAIKENQQAMVKKIVACRPSSESMTLAFSALFDCDFAEDTTLEYIEIFKNGLTESPDPNTIWDSHITSQKEPLALMCLKKYPRGVKVLEALLQAGAHVDKTVPCVIEDEQGLEHVSLLLWALLQPQQRISPCVIDCLLQHGADPNFTSTSSLTTPLLVAARERPPDVVSKLIQHGADVSLSDRHGKTPLVYASQRGQILSMKYLISKGAIADDGSLHEAARTLNAEAVRLLLAHQHDPGLPSMLHDGRSALAELCLNATGPRAKIRQTIDALVVGGANLLEESQGKPLLMHALDNQTACIDVTTELLRSGMWRHINSDCNRYVENGIVHSPTTYITKCLANSPREYSPELLRILRANGCKDVYYKMSGPQPPDMVGAPPEIVAQEEKQQARLQRLKEEEEEHQLTLRRNREIADQQRELMTRMHHLRLQQDRESVAERDIALQNSARLQLQLEAEAECQRRRFADEQRVAELAKQQEMDRLRIESERKRNQLRLEYEEASSRTQKSLLDARLAADLKRLQETDSMSQRQYERELDILRRQEQLMKERKRLLDSETPENKLLEYDGSKLD